ncbi:hypothetical protein BGW37DRAFT_490817 [Umbelopsis sp. PMI_123]|nr:hypothetical protein BGW37DRAFT_490817 [Umbelopsis sp. PMI_123]
MIVCPREKRLGQRIKKAVTIHSHSLIDLCPVAAFRAYILRHAHRPCLYPHPVLPHVTIHYLIPSISDCHRPIQPKVSATGPTLSQPSSRRIHPIHAYDCELSVQLVLLSWQVPPWTLW